jgi:flagellar hook protein FlgE
MTDMEVISNNISNANTIGFKASYTMFGDMYPSLSGTSTQAGLGVQVTGVFQNFANGGQSPTGMPLDLMITQNGFFVMNDSNTGTVSYTRNGNFQLDENGYITNGGLRLQGYPAVNGVVVSSGSLSDLQISGAPIPAIASTNVTEKLNLNSVPGVNTGPFDPNNNATYNSNTTETIYDSLGNKHTFSLYFIKTAENTWSTQALVDGTNVGTGTVNFDANGQMTSVTGLSNLSYAPGTGASSPQTFSVDLTGTTQFASANQTVADAVNGYPAGTMSTFQIDNNGNVIATYSNAQRLMLGQVAIANFQSPSGLASIGNMSWVETTESGSPILNPTNSNNNISAGVLESSNVDLTQEMINLIGAQNSFQANAQVEQTYNEIMKTVIQL